MMQQRFGIIGCGRIAQRHAELITKSDKLVAVCDVDKNRAQSLGKRFGAKIYYSQKDLQDAHPDINIISICTPNGLHAAQSIEALNSGYHVICEKPMALHVKDCEAMISTAELTGRKLFVVKQNRYNPPVQAVKKILAEGKLGKIYNVQINCFWNRDNAYYHNTWKGTKSLDGGILFTQFSHFIDVAYWLIGDIEKASGYSGNFHHKRIIEFEDSGVAILEFTNGAMGALNYSINSFEKNMEGSITIIGEQGAVKIGGEYMNKLEYSRISHYEIQDMDAGRGANEYGTYSGSMSNHDKVYANVKDVLANNRPPDNNLLDSLKTVEIITKIYAATSQISIL